jgi:hypothetical protein
LPLQLPRPFGVGVLATFPASGSSLEVVSARTFLDQRFYLFNSALQVSAEKRGCQAVGESNFQAQNRGQRLENMLIRRIIPAHLFTHFHQKIIPHGQNPYTIRLLQLRLYLAQVDGTLPAL